MIITVINKALLARDYRVALSKRINGAIAMPKPEYELTGVNLFPVRIYGGFNLIREFIGLWDLAFLIMRNRNSLFHFYSSKYYTLGPILCRIFRVKAKPVISINGLGRLAKREVGLKFNFLSFFIRLGLRNSQGVIFQNRADQMFFKARFSAAMVGLKQQVIYSGIEKPQTDFDIHRYSGGLSRSDDKLQVLYVGRQNSDKGISHFYDLAERYNEFFNFKIIGEEPDNPRLKSRLGLLIKKDILTWLCYTPEVMNEMSASLCLVIPSDREGLPRVLMEAYSCNTPAVGFNVPGVGEFIAPSVTGELASEHSLEALAKALFLVRENGKEFYRDGIAKFFEENFSIDKFIQSSSQFYERLER